VHRLCTILNFLETCRRSGGGPYTGFNAKRVGVGKHVMSERFLTPEMLSKELEIPTSTLAKWRLYGGGPRYAKMGKNIRYERGDVDLWVESQKRRTTASEAA
jgi:hypothetical protein